MKRNPPTRNARWAMKRSSMKSALLAVATFAMASSAGAADESKFFFRDGDVVAVIGDSITEHAHYVNAMEIWTVTRFPSWNIKFRNVGKGSDTAPGGAGRFESCIAPVAPTALTVNFGMNDAGYKEFDEVAFDKYQAGLQKIADQAAELNLRVAWITPQPVELNPNDKSRGYVEGYNDTLAEFSNGLKTFALNNQGLFVDQFTPYLAVLDKVAQTSPGTLIAGGDWIHPGAPGGTLQAASILKGMSFPRLVSSVEIDAGAAQTLKSANCEISELKSTENGGVRFLRRDAALPYFPDPVVGKPRGTPPASEILKWTPILEEMNDYGLKVSGLKPGRYEVKLAGTAVAEYSAEELSAGVNLAGPALVKGPVAEQVWRVIKAVTEKNTYFHKDIFRGIMIFRIGPPGSTKDPEVEKAFTEGGKEELVAKRLKELETLDEAVRATLVMQPHLVEITPLGTKES